MGRQPVAVVILHITLHGLRGEFGPRQNRQLPRAVDSKGLFLYLVVVKC
jgi:hypothetical protein